MKLVPGLVLDGRYQLERNLAQGGMGEVWSGTHVATLRQVAIKRMLLPYDSARHDQARARFLLEARAACAVEHPNVVQVIDFIEQRDEPPMMVMELLQGETLAARLEREHSLPLEAAAEVLLPVASAVGAAHNRGIIHRDLKPSNIFLCRDELGSARVKVLDFGIAKWLAPTGEAPALHTQTGSTMGTPSYMAPEQAVGETAVDHRADLWSLGVILYECLSGSRPIEGENAAQLLVRLLSTAIVPIDCLVPGLPPDVTALVTRMLRRSPERRPEDLREVARVLERYTEARPPAFGAPSIRSREVGQRQDPQRASAPASEPLATDGTFGVMSDTLPDPFRPSRAPRRWWTAGGLVLGLILGVFGASRWFAMRPVVSTMAAKAPPESSQGAESPKKQSAVSGASAAPLGSALGTQPLAELGASVLNEARDSASRTLLPPSTPNAIRAPRWSAPPKPAPPEAVARPQAELQRGESCEQSSQCASHMCVAFVCE